MKLIIVLLLSISFSMPAFSQTVTVDKNSGSKTWQVVQHDVHFSLTQIKPEQALAFYSNRGFAIKQIQAYANSCVFMAVIRNDKSKNTVHFISNSWLVNVKNQAHKLTHVNDWLTRLKKQPISKASLIAFKWAQFPIEQTYQAGGDWNQGMLSIGLPSESQFTITALWDSENTNYQSILTGVECAK